MEEVRFIDLFAGIGGIRRGLEKQGFTCVFSSEWDEECAKTYEANFGEKPAGDITKIDEKTIPDHEILAGGFPCQAFSAAGKQKGFDDTRGTLFFDILRIAKEKKPKILFLENVKNLIYHNGRQTLKIIIKHLEELGYKVTYQVLNAKDYGVAQSRERIIIIASKDKPFDFGKIKPKNPNVKIKDILEKENSEMKFLSPEEYTILDKSLWKEQKTGMIFVGYRNKPIRKKGARPNTEHLSRVHKQCNRIYSSDGTHPTISSTEIAGRFHIYHNGKVRKLTINECFRLMGFPDSYKKISSNGERYRQIGNSVAIPMIEAVAEEIKNQLF
ncbi:MAG: DNA cytosine methyltransferase [Candidatus Pacearchaeota archaeon]|nr:DNA cytosine methyltransferase [Candidatus Pacearchaeota archaeon]